MTTAKKKPELRKAVPKVSSFSDGLKYPWGAPKRLLNILWALIPFIGWLALVSYSQSIIRVIVAGNKTSLPEFIGFGEHLKKGFLLFVKSLPLLIAYFLIFSVPGIGGVAGFIAFVFFLPYLMINLFVTDRFEESFNIQKVWDNVFNNLREYLIAYVKTIGFVLIYGVLSIILIGIPCLHFGCLFFLVEFYTNHN
ncbi:MAG: DUF4013 domain-containing protein [Nanoarchaeota archaeon]|nr:DUF4013 domain-containing protein [Nanoarchaeota archaeon]